ncbi:BppU family phage baseplate upper protein [Paenilisteria newyorkensis]|uniref:BppU family phage baseplate upper protein n=1 Tax=Listeria newyorkensis TaxID=1497681 RepID=UPI0023594C6F|nr:BppU family phage baseplate upper protein [Listeria newyorkensis]WAO20813.1 BppU family phage baseplate upper protein [Listeria newyorkensis]
MSVKQYKFNLDLVSDSITPLILARVTENNAVTTVVQLTNNGAAIPDFSDYRPIFECRLPGGYFVRDDGSTYDNMEILDPDKGIIKYTMAKEVFARHGILNLCYFVLEKGGSTGFQILESLDLSADVRVTTPNFTIRVEEDATQGNIEQKDFISDIAALNNFIRESTAEAMEVLNAAIAQLNESTDTANELIALINSNDVVLISETINWQKAKLTADSGVAKSPPNVTTLAAIIEQGSFYINSTVAAALTDAPSTGGFRLENHKLITGTAIEQHARYFSPTNAASNRHFFRYVGATASPWREYENTVGSQAKADAAKTAAIAYVDAKFLDSGWIDLPLKTNYSVVGTTSRPQYRRIGNAVKVRGLMARVPGTAAGVFAALPTGFRTSSLYGNGRKVAQQSSIAGASATVNIKPTGDLEIQAVSVDTANIWLDGIEFDAD